MPHLLLSLLFALPFLAACALNGNSAQCNEELLPQNKDSVLLNEDFIDTAQLNIRLHPQGAYTDAQKEIAEMRLQFQEHYRCHPSKGWHLSVDEDSLLKQAGIFLEEKIVNSLLPFWYGTEWDFNGITDTPGTGKIACGYLVSTVLKHCGFNLNRYTLAQQSAWNEARTLQLSDKVKYFEGDYENFAQAFKKVYGDGLYLVGMDYHVGLLLLRKGELLFIHSSYIPPAEAVMEKIALSPAFHATRGYHIAEITTNLKLLKKWVLQEKVEVRKDNP